MKIKNYGALIIIAVFLFIVMIIYSFKHKYSCRIVDTTIVTVRKSDTLWSLARKIQTKKDIREVVADIKEINGITPAIYEGQKIKIPEYDK